MSLWIACKDKMPEGDAPVLIYYSNIADNLVPYGVSNPEFVRLHWQKWCSHWAELPPPPSQEK